MKLYGMPIAVIPDKDDVTSYTITCTPIATTSENPRQYEIVTDDQGHELRYTQKFSSKNKQELAVAYKKLVDTLETLVGMQRKSCEVAWQDFQPVSVIIGQDSNLPVNYNILHQIIMGKPFDESIYHQYYKAVDQVKDAALKNPELMKEAKKIHYSTGSRVFAFMADSLEKAFPDLSAKDQKQLVDEFNTSDFFKINNIHISEYDFCDGRLKDIFNKILSGYDENVAVHKILPIDLVGSISTIMDWQSYLSSKANIQLNETEQKNVDKIAQAIAWALLLRHDCLPNQINELEYRKHRLTPFRITGDIAQWVKELEATECLKKQSNVDETIDNENAKKIIMNTSSKLAGLMDKIYIKPGDFTKNTLGHPAHLLEDYEKRLQEEVKKELCRDPDAFYMHCNKALESGRNVGRDKNKAYFATLQPMVTCPELSAAFDKGFQKEYHGHFPRWIKSLSDPPAPPFVDPMCFMLAAQHEIVSGKRFKQDVDDNIDWRERLSQAASNARANLTNRTLRQ